MKKGRGKSKDGLDCVRCDRIAERTKLRIDGREIDGWKCKCGEKYLDPIQTEQWLRANKLRKQRFELKLGQIKSNLILRIPTEVQKAFGLKKGEKVVLTAPTGKKIEFAPV